MRRFLSAGTVGYLSAAVGIAAATAVCTAFSGSLNNTTVALAMLLVVLFTASEWGRRPGILAAVLGALAFDYYFIPPIGAFGIAHAQDWIAFAALFITATAVGHLSVRAKQRTEQAEAGRKDAQLAAAYNRRLIEADLDPLVTIGPDGRISDANAAAEEITGRPRTKLLGTDFSAYFTDPARARAGYERAFHDGLLRDYPLEIKRRDERVIPVLYNASIYRDERGEAAGVLASTHDVSGLKNAEDAIRRLASFPQLAPMPIIEFDRDMRVSYSNPAMQSLLAECGIKDSRLFAPAGWVEKLSNDEASDATGVHELEISGRAFEERIHFSRESRSLRIWAADITERKQAMRSLVRLNRTYKTLSGANLTLVRAKSEPELLNSMCQVLIDPGGYRMAWIALAEHDEGKSVKIAAVAGRDDGYLERARISWADDERGRGPTGTAIRTGQPQVNLDFANNPRMGPWREEALKRGYVSSAALPLKDARGVFGALTIYAGEPEALGPGELDLFIELAGDLAYGIAALRDRGERETAVRRLSASLEDTVGAIASTIEIRDPYTAGHQRRVAQLAARIARELGLPEEQTRGIYLAGLIHDSGKINVPAEILSKPGRLTPIELLFIRTHPQSGYDIVKGVDFPWPIAETIFQHHERLDGSGYPRGLAGKAVIIEARIVSVADVTEAIMAHRPYRAALGLDAALAEIAAGKGHLYDPAAVDACIDLFRNKGFAFH
ncbi:MAG: HD domain-containing phosphohydrolase [Elusimicrobiota bacterium]